VCWGSVPGRAKYNPNDDCMKDYPTPTGGRVECQKND
jgi:hypothetical protein